MKELMLKTKPGRRSGKEAVVSQQQGHRFNPLSVQGLHVVHVSAWVLSGYTGFSPQSKNMHVRRIGNPKVSVRVSVCL